MKELWINFWTKQSYAVRGLRLLGVAVGQVLVAVEVPDEAWGPVVKGLGWLLTAGAPLITGSDSTPSGVPSRKPERVGT